MCTHKSFHQWSQKLIIWHLLFSGTHFLFDQVNLRSEEMKGHWSDECLMCECYEDDRSVCCGCLKYGCACGFATTEVLNGRVQCRACNCKCGQYYDPLAICLNVHLVTVKKKVNVIVTLDVVSVATAVFPQQQDSLLKMENSKQCQN